MLRALFVVLPLVLVAADDKDILGTWKAVAGEKSGKKAPEATFKNLVFEFKADKLIIKEGEQAHEAGYKLDPDKKPKAIDLILKDGGKSETVKGIYVLDGDELKICAGHPGADRPTEFATKEGSKTDMLTFKREKK